MNAARRATPLIASQRRGKGAHACSGLGEGGCAVDSGFWVGWGRRRQGPWSWVMFAGGSHAWVSHVGSCLLRLESTSCLRSDEGATDRRAARAALGPPRGAASWVCSPPRLRRPVGVPSRSPAPWALEGVSGLSSDSLFSMPLTQGTCPGGQRCSDLPASAEGRLDPRRRPRTPEPHLSLGMGTGRAL